MTQKVYLTILSIIFLVGGLLGGYYYGHDKGFDAGLNAGVEKGRADLLAEQKKAQEDELAKIAEEANVFNEIEEAANPFKDAYKNPFGQ